MKKKPTSRQLRIEKLYCTYFSSCIISVWPLGYISHHTQELDSSSSPLFLGLSMFSALELLPSYNTLSGIPSECRYIIILFVSQTIQHSCPQKGHFHQPLHWIGRHLPIHHPRIARARLFELCLSHEGVAWAGISYSR